MSECACVYIDHHDNDPCSFFSSKEVKAKKEHACGECGAAIQSGDMYERVVGKWDDGLDCYKTCQDCLSVRAQFFCKSWIYGEIWSDLQEHLNCVSGKVSSDCMMGLTERARAKVADLIQEIWNDEDLDREDDAAVMP